MLGTSSASLNSFTLLNSCNDDLLETIASCCDINLGEEDKVVHENLSVMKLEEVLRRVIAEANYKSLLNKRSEESHALENENLEMMGVDNDFTREGETMTQNSEPKRQKGSKLSRELRRISYQW
jgi:hypothetical protein